MTLDTRSRKLEYRLPLIFKASIVRAQSDPGGKALILSRELGSLPSASTLSETGFVFSSLSTFFVNVRVVRLPGTDGTCDATDGERPPGPGPGLIDIHRGSPR